MTSPQIIQQAKAGDAQAIAQLLNLNLNPKEIQVTVQPVSYGTLSLMLVGSATASRGRVENYLRDTFQKLAAPSIQAIELSYHQRDSVGSLPSDSFSRPLWQSKIELIPIADALSQPAATPKPQRLPVDAPVEARTHVPQSLPVDAPVAVKTHVSQSLIVTPRAVESSKPKRYANPFSIWLQWQATSLGALLLIYLLGMGISSLVMVPLLARTGGSIPLNGVVPFLLLGVLALFLMPIAALIVGDGQTRLLRKWLHRIGGWRWITPLGVLVGFGVAVGLQFVGMTLSGGYVFTAATDASEAYIQGGVAVVICSGLGVGLGFLTLGFFQWLMLQGAVPKAHQWIWSNAISSILSLFFGLLVGVWLTKQFLGDIASGDSITWLVVAFLGSTASWFLFNGFTGITMARLLSKVPLLEES